MMKKRKKTKVKEGQQKQRGGGYDELFEGIFQKEVSVILVKNPYGGRRSKREVVVQEEKKVCVDSCLLRC